MRLNTPKDLFLQTQAKTLHSAIRELRREYELRVGGDSSWRSLPSTAQDLSLRAVSETVLSSFPGVEGGFTTGSQFLGYSFPTHDGGSPKIDVPAAERQAIEEVIMHSRARGTAERVL